jgi:hypothetical protein
MRESSSSLRGIAVAIALTVLLSGCGGSNDPAPSDNPASPQPDAQEAPVIDPAQARTDLYSQLDAVQALVGGEWGNSDDSTPVQCSLGGVDGVTFTGSRLSNDSAGEESLDAVASLWDEMGFAITTQNDVGPYKRVIATSPSDPGNVLVFGLAENAMSLSGQGACGEGDLLEWVKKINQEFEDAADG